MEKIRKKLLIYNLMMGNYDLQNLPDSCKSIVKNEMSADSECEKLYSEVYEANRRLCERL